MHNKQRLIVKYLILVVLTSSFLALSLSTSIFDKTNYPHNNQEVKITIPQGSYLSQIADSLYGNNLIENRITFILAALITNKSRSMKSGRYVLNQGLSNVGILREMESTNMEDVIVTIPEGLRSDEIISMLCRKIDVDSLELVQLLEDSVLLNPFGKSLHHLEGTLFPDTYNFIKGTSPRIVFEKLTNRFLSQLPKDWKQKSEALGLNLNQILTLASLVEKETAKSDERRLVAGVYLNRVRADMHLNADPTLIYMLIKRDEWDGNLQKRHKKIRDPYNTYRYRGLPPGPIASPGRASIEAVLNPENTQFLYFVGKNDGSGEHDFSETLRQHINKVNRYQKRKSQ
jgi:UPF0755 protein